MQQRIRFQLLGIVAALAILGSGCMEQYARHSDGISPYAGDAMYANRAVHRVRNPIWSSANDERIRSDGKRTVPIIDSYHSKEGAEKQPQEPSPPPPPILR